MKTKAMMSAATGVTALAMAFLAGCTAGPNYVKPRIAAPEVYRGVPGNAATRAASASLGDEKWWQVFQDPQLQDLIRTALQQNYDVRIAATRILEAEAQWGLTRSEALPSAAAQAGANDQRQVRSISRAAITHQRLYRSGSAASTLGASRPTLPPNEVLGPRPDGRCPPSPAGREKYQALIADGGRPC